jgi:hypothetical protein
MAIAEAVSEQRNLILAFPYRMLPTQNWLFVPKGLYTRVQTSHGRQDCFPP